MVLVERQNEHEYNTEINGKQKQSEIITNNQHNYIINISTGLKRQTLILSSLCALAMYS